jgi:hypothetical protein
MRSSFHKETIAVLLAIAGLFVTSGDIMARPSRQHYAKGVILSVDQTNHSMTVQLHKETKPVVFFWKESTRFRYNDRKKTHVLLATGDKMYFYYRREMGRYMLREVRATSKG